MHKILPQELRIGDHAVQAVAQTGEGEISRVCDPFSCMVYYWEQELTSESKSLKRLTSYEDNFCFQRDKNTISTLIASAIYAQTLSKHLQYLNTFFNLIPFFGY